MTPARARDLLQRLGDPANRSGAAGDKGETARLGWSEGRIAFASSRGLRRAAEVTAGLDRGDLRAPARRRARRGGLALARRARPAAGSASGRGAARVPPRSCRPPRARSPSCSPRRRRPPSLELLNRQALTSDAFLHGASFLRERLGQPVFHPAIHLRDDPTDPRGLPFPFDLLGAAARPVDLVAGGVALTPAIDDRLARELDRPPTAQRVAPDEAVSCNLFLLPGGASESELLRAAEGGRLDRARSTRWRPSIRGPCASGRWRAAPGGSPAARSGAPSRT